jgi:hypothetical protein
MTEDRLTDPRAPHALIPIAYSLHAEQNRTPVRWPPCVVALVVSAFLAACSQTVNELTFFTDPGKYEWHSCEQLLPQRKYWETREQELRLLIDKARQSAGGTAISVIAYQSDYVGAREEIKVIDATARIKKCKIPDDPQSNSAIR